LNKRSSKNLALLQPLQPARGLTGELVSRLGANSRTFVRLGGSSVGWPTA